MTERIESAGVPLVPKVGEKVNVTAGAYRPLEVVLGGASDTLRLPVPKRKKIRKLLLGR